VLSRRHRRRQRAHPPTANAAVHPVLSHRRRRRPSRAQPPMPPSVRAQPSTPPSVVSSAANAAVTTSTAEASVAILLQTQLGEIIQRRSTECSNGCLL
jgi:hypothetical protein